MIGIYITKLLIFQIQNVNIVRKMIIFLKFI